MSLSIKNVLKVAAIALAAVVVNEKLGLTQKLGL